MGTYDRYTKRIDLLSARIKASQRMLDFEVIPEKLKNPVDNIEYIYTLLGENKIQLKLTQTEDKRPDLIDIGIEVKYETS